MPKLVLTFRPDGTMETLRSKAFDPRILGNAEVERISSIEFDKKQQQFYIRWLKGPLHCDVDHPRRPNRKPACDARDYGVHVDKNNETMFFDTYELAVECEIENVNAMRLAGASFQ